MQRVFEALEQNLSWFIEQREHLVLVIDATEQEIPYVLKTFDTVEQTHNADIFLCFAHAVVDTESYLATLMDQLKAQIQAVNEIRLHADQPGWPKLPHACTAHQLPPSERLKALLDYIKARLPAGHHTIVLGLLPVEIPNPAAYAQLVRGLLPAQGLEPWMANVRIVLRDDRHQPFVIPHIDQQAIARVVVYEDLDLGPDAMTRSLHDEAVDPERSEPERALALLQLAAIDHAHRRYDESREKWGLLFNYYQRNKNFPMQALCIWHRAEALRAVGQWTAAKIEYQQGLAVAQDLSTLPITLQLLTGIAEVCIALEQWEEASGFLALADQIASKTLQAHTKCDLMVRRGVVLLACGQALEAHAHWRAAADLSRGLEYPERCESALTYLIELFEQVGMPAEASAHRQELKQVQHQRRATPPPSHSPSASPSVTP